MNVAGAIIRYLATFGQISPMRALAFRIDRYSVCCVGCVCLSRSTTSSTLCTHLQCNRSKRGVPVDRYLVRFRTRPALAGLRAQHCVLLSSRITLCSKGRCFALALKCKSAGSWARSWPCSPVVGVVRWARGGFACRGARWFRRSCARKGRVDPHRFSCVVLGISGGPTGGGGAVGDHDCEGGE